MAAEASSSSCSPRPPPPPSQTHIAYGSAPAVGTTEAIRSDSEFFIGVTREVARAAPTPALWRNDVLSYHPVPGDEEKLPDPYTAAEGEDPILNDYVVVLRATNLAAQVWINQVVPDRLYYDFIREADSREPFRLHTNDHALTEALSAEQLRALEAEFTRDHQRLAEEHNLHLETCDVGDVVISRNPTKNTAPFITKRVHTYSVSMAQMYGHSADTDSSACSGNSIFEALRKSDVKLPAYAEIIHKYLTLHEGGGQAVMVPISFWNRMCATFEQMAAAAAKSSAPPSSKETTTTTTSSSSSSETTNPQP